MRFSHLNFLDEWGILAQKIYNASAIFHQFSKVKNVGWSQQPSNLGQLVTGETQCTPTQQNPTLPAHYIQENVRLELQSFS